MYDEQEWVARLQQGDGSALEPLMRCYGDQIYRTAFLLLKDRHLAEDLSQDVFLIAFRKILQFRGEGSLRGWLLRITVNACRSNMRRASWKRMFVREIKEHELSVTEPGLEQAADREALSEYIGNLPYKYREVLVLHYYQDLSVLEISALLGDKVNTVKSKLLRGRAILKEQLTKGGWQHE
ncbi:RNA polymerase sigma factor [Paenibacillus eucommiae]|uniref:RNA polymerase sigma-70 factor (ECF subfamily) n=1 Tax=Paenibacillus eucommiae TaxID=1355755 RepID=A0ABS4IPU1_9BACL|nr:sigma-70 family RNA polymerase sigma factor [Paenibacillus eucommiae]MBP1989170.1 RNA polymerase sigma-70 factor (ECF subfamily) [Paenibacillus eucommiae]